MSSRVQAPPTSFWTDKNVLVTGCTGFLGTWLCQVLVGAGANVVGLVRDKVPRSRLIQSRIIDHINVVSGEIENYLLLERLLNEYEVQTVFHLAAQTIVGVANENPLSTFEANIRGSWSLLEACRRTKRVEQVVLASSDKAYGEHEQLPYGEEAPLLGRHPYDVSKTCADLIAQAYANTYGLPVCITRFGNLFGGGDINFNRLIPGTIRAVVRGQRPVIRSDGKYTRDYIYVEDAARAYTLLAENMSKNPTVLGHAFNFSYECPLTALEVGDQIIDSMGRNDLQLCVLGAARNEIRHQYLSSRKAREELGWCPIFTFNEGLSRTIRWYIDWFERETAS